MASDGKNTCPMKTPRSTNPPSPLSPNHFDLLQEVSPIDEHSPTTFSSPKETPKVITSTREKVLTKVGKTRTWRRINHVNTLVRSFRGIASNGEATNRVVSMNVTPQIIAIPNVVDCDISSQYTKPHMQEALKWLGIWHKWQDNGKNKTARLSGAKLDRQWPHFFTIASSLGNLVKV